MAFMSGVKTQIGDGYGAVAPSIENEDGGLLPYVRILIRRKWIVLGCVALAAAAAGLYSLTLEPSYTAVATLYPAKQAESSGLSGLMSLGANLGLPGISAKDPTDILVDIAKTNSFLGRVVAKKFYSAKLGREATLREIVPIKSKRQELRNFYLLESLRKTIEFESNKRSGVLTIKVQAPEAELAKALADTVISELNRFYRELMSSKKASYRQFLEKRLAEAEANLKETEDRLRNYRERNMLSSNSPEQNLLMARYTRDIRVNEELYLTLRKEYEVARLEEQKDLPALDMLDSPETPLFKSGPQRRKLVLFFGFIGLLAGAGLAVIVDRRAAIRSAFGQVSRRSPA
jgi:uncharacterized protein involved in exopolysaccharide biosynthesis